MVQLALLMPLREWEGWTGETIPLGGRAAGGCPGLL